jgi:hypothetical protein
VRALARRIREGEQEGEGQDQAPETDRDRSDVGKPNQPRPKGERDVAEQESRKSPAMRRG